MKNYLKNEIKHLPFILIVFVLLYGIVTIATSYQYDSGDIRFDNTGTDLESVNVQDALDETFHHVTDYTNMNTRVTNIENNFLNKTYPVGSIYISVTNTNPSTLFGGTWVAYAQGRTLIGVGTGTDSNSTSRTFDINITGGEYTHKLTVAEMPSHTHQTNGTNTDAYGTSRYGAVVSGDYQGRIMVTGILVDTSSSGNNNYHNNIQPYIAVYMWKRTA